MQPIAVYEERRPERRFRFELFPEAIEVRGSTTQTDVEISIPLVQLHPSIARVWSLPYWFHVGVWVFLLGIVSLMALVVYVMSQELRIVPPVWMGFTALGVTAGIVVMVWNRRKTETARFQSDAGITILAIAKTARNAEAYDEFLALLQKQIRIARGGAGLRNPSLPIADVDS